MKWASRVGVFTMGVLMSAICAKPAAASPVFKWHGQQTASQTAVAPDQADDAALDSFLAVLANPAGAGLDEACVAYQMTNMNGLAALSVNGLGGVAELTATEMDLMADLKLALGEMIDNQDALMLEAQLAQDLIAAMTGMPLIGIDSLAAIDTLAADDANLDSLLAGLLSNDGPSDVTIGQADLAEATDPDITDSTLFASSLGGGGSGGFWAGGNLVNGGSNGGNSYGGDAGGGASGGGGSKATPHHHHSHVKHDRLAAEAAAAAAVPLPAGAWGGLVLMAGLAAAHKLRGKRTMA